MRSGFTLIELLIVMAILAVAVAITVPNMDAITTTQVSLAAKDSLRLMRYARNMALQTQQPIIVTFEPGKISLASALDEPTARTAPVNTEEASPEGAGKVAFDLTGGELDQVGFAKSYERVDFRFLGYNDSITRENKDLWRRVPGETEEAAAAFSSQVDEGPFSITVRANGTTRPFSIRVYEREGNEANGDQIDFDFLCAGTIGND